MSDVQRQTFWQRRALKSLVKYARKQPNEQLSPEDWEAYFRWSAQPRNRAFKRLLRAIPSTPRCGFCGAPFAGIGGRLVRPLGYKPSRKNPTVCATCVEMAPPGGLTTDVGVLFVDLRGFTAQSEGITPAAASEELRRFYAYAERVFFPKALIDKLIGDEVMALYLPVFIRPGSLDVSDDDRRHVVGLMVKHAHELLHLLGYGTPAGPEFHVGIGIDFGEAFVGNIGSAAVNDFTAVGDVVNTASRLQGAAASGDVVLSARIARLLDQPPGIAEEIMLKGKQEPVEIRRVQWFSA